MAEFELLKEENESLKGMLEQVTTHMSQVQNSLEVKNKELELFRQENQSSLEFASLFQKAIYPDTQKINKELGSMFSINRPRDIIGGDFLWYRECHRRYYIACVDCTGHGIPGGMLSMAAYFSLNYVFDQNGNQDTQDFLHNLNYEFYRYLHMNTSDQSILNHGMELGVIMIDKQTKEVDFSGVGHRLLAEVDGEWQEFRGTKGTIGSQQLELKPATKINFKSKLRLYLHSDGVVDKFGGPKNKKFLRKRMKRLLNGTTRLNICKQGEIMNAALAEWQGDHEQTDDIIMIGLELT